ncbi:MFS transporter, partial [Paeniglutamicibacter cryotolerans]
GESNPDFERPEALPVAYTRATGSLRTCYQKLRLNTVTIGLCFHALMYAGQPAIMAEMFPTRMRYSGVSLGYQVTSIVAGSMAPIIATALLQAYSSWLPVAIYVAVACAVTTVAVVTLKETRGISLHDIDDADARKHGLNTARVSN